MAAANFSGFAFRSLVFSLQASLRGASVVGNSQNGVVCVSRDLFGYLFLEQFLYYFLMFLWSVENVIKSKILIG